MVDVTPHLSTLLHAPLDHLQTHLLAHQADIERWLRLQWQDTPAPFYASVDLRNAGFKLAPVDTNLFPAGFNNLNASSIPLAIQAVQSAIERLNISARNILLIPENHTRNLFYLESVATLRDILQKAGYQVRIGSLLPDLQTPQAFTLPSKQSLLLEPLIRDDDCLVVKDFVPCLVLLNNDLSLGRPPILEYLHQQIVPPLHVGWSSRLKSSYFNIYSQVAKEFSEQIDIDPWLIDPQFRNCGEINFMKKEGYECLADNVDALLSVIQRKYSEYNVPHEPFVIVKADAGSYGMGVMTVHNGEEILALNRKQRTRMSSTKEGQKISQVILQEGVYTFETWGPKKAVAEPVVYMIDHFVVGGFYRVHTTRGINENLNAPGMHFEPLAFINSCITPDKNMAVDADPNRFYAYGVIARLALLAAARELN
ncbi:glutamate--cysteine ligase [Candidatus Thiomargarita nelsonii]|uniref:Glutamate--cysteine ligase n=1 Tax=Candidatus Thiomargarita nelsonii TaxID=1003181 RepID=A0A0A6RW58_9GAMM|nr:glutamate--cysteine ligase [Candidatus Thiomargarita nelsonii]